MRRSDRRRGYAKRADGGHVGADVGLQVVDHMLQEAGEGAFGFDDVVVEIRRRGTDHRFDVGDGDRDLGIGWNGRRGVGAAPRATVSTPNDITGSFYDHYVNRRRLNRSCGPSTRRPK